MIEGQELVETGGGAHGWWGLLRTNTDRKSVV